ncbi:MAG: SDR family NAD(P)-dependent oxidoreductase [Porticoccaceae bacterium]|jgi:short-subunit dehydrogenase|nr:SDR family NAD(P)-dependent oxidoreductase [Porticoccaceae bacterium]MDG1307613.1 SDR family NAD(P)-dependent oxidoreductase [Porticoccaceae bacterium]
MKQAIIIGASSGIGWELGVQLAAKGYQLGLMARRDKCLEKLADSLPGTHFIQTTDVANAEQAQEELNDLIERMGDVELIIVNSGVGSKEKRLDWIIEREMIDVNIRGFAAMSLVAMNYFVKRGGGHLAGVSSAAAHFSGGLTLTYNASKAFASNYLNGMRSRAARSKLPITVTTIEPGFVETPMVEGRPVWMATVEKAVTQMVAGLMKKRDHIYITRRWVLVVRLLQIIPDWLIRKFI